MQIYRFFVKKQRKITEKPLSLHRKPHFPDMKIVIAIDSFKGCLTSAEANHAAAEAIRSCIPDAQIVELPVSDGGEGWLTPFIERLGWNSVECIVHDPLNRPVRALYATKGHRAAIEIAQACGLTLLSPNERNPLVATTRGVGEIIVHAVEHGASEFIIGLGGSATSDAGIGMVDVLREKGVIGKSSHLHFTIATDVRNPLCGPQGAAHVFAPQKGATPEMVRQLDQRAQEFAQESARQLGHDLSNAPGAGAAGGLGYAFMQFLNAKSQSGADLLLDMLQFETISRDADLIITGEGHADRQTLMGKLPFVVMKRANNLHFSSEITLPTPQKSSQVGRKEGRTILISGRIDDRDQLLRAGFHDAICINPPHLPSDIATLKEVAINNIQESVHALLTRFSLTAPHHQM